MDVLGAHQPLAGNNRSDAVNDWIFHYRFPFWAACLTVGGVAGVAALYDTFGVLSGLIAGVVGGAGTGLILSISRYIAQNETEDDLTRR